MAATLQTETTSGQKVTVRSERSTHHYKVEIGIGRYDCRSTSVTTYTAWDATTTEYVGAIGRDPSGHRGPASIRDAGRWL